jgi:hypothetical protein
VADWFAVKKLPLIRIKSAASCSFVQALTNVAINIETRNKRPVPVIFLNFGLLVGIALSFVVHVVRESCVFKPLE